MAIINPSDFTDAQWAELYYAHTILSCDARSEALPFEASAPDIVDAARFCRNKANEIEDGTGVLCGLNDQDVDEQGWADDLNAAATVLESYLKKKEPTL